MFYKYELPILEGATIKFAELLEDGKILTLRLENDVILEVEVCHAQVVRPKMIRRGDTVKIIDPSHDFNRAFGWVSSVEKDGRILLKIKDKMLIVDEHQIRKAKGVRL